LQDDYDIEEERNINNEVFERIMAIREKGASSIIVETKN
jgi:hypothetical protein